MLIDSEQSCYLGFDLLIREDRIEVYEMGRLLSTERCMSSARRFCRGYRREARKAA